MEQDARPGAARALQPHLAHDRRQATARLLVLGQGSWQVLRVRRREAPADRDPLSAAVDQARADGRAALHPLSGARRAEHPGVPDAAARQAGEGPAARRAGARRPVLARRDLALRRGGAVPRVARLRRAAAGFPRQHGLRLEALQLGPEAVGPGDAGRSERRCRRAGEAGNRQQGAGLHRRRQLRRLCGDDGTRARPTGLEMRHQLGRRD